jgi:hypothetical protein
MKTEHKEIKLDENRKKLADFLSQPTPTSKTVAPPRAHHSRQIRSGQSCTPYLVSLHRAATGRRSIALVKAPTR